LLQYGAVGFCKVVVEKGLLVVNQAFERTQRERQKDNTDNGIADLVPV